MVHDDLGIIILIEMSSLGRGRCPSGIIRGEGIIKLFALQHSEVSDRLAHNQVGAERVKR